jgi:hypothetical protein
MALFERTEKPIKRANDTAALVDVAVPRKREVSVVVETRSEPFERGSAERLHIHRGNGTFARSETPRSRIRYHR